MSKLIIIEDSHNELGKNIRITDSHMFIEPQPITEIEDWEDRLKQLDIPYVLAQIDDSSKIKFYTLFVNPADFKGFSE